MGRGTALAVSGVSVCLLGLILTQFYGLSALLGLLMGIIGVGVAFAGAVDEAEVSRMASPR